MDIGMDEDVDMKQEEAVEEQVFMEAAPPTTPACAPGPTGIVGTGLTPTPSHPEPGPGAFSSGAPVAKGQDATSMQVQKPDEQVVGVGKLIGPLEEWIAQNSPITLGRFTPATAGDKAFFGISQKKNVSRKHVQLAWNGRRMRWELTVLSKNGCHVDSTPVLNGAPPVPLRHRACICIDGVEFFWLYPNGTPQAAIVLRNKAGAEGAARKPAVKRKPTTTTKDTKEKKTPKKRKPTGAAKNDTKPTSLFNPAAGNAEAAMLQGQAAPEQPATPMPAFEDNQPVHATGSIPKEDTAGAGPAAEVAGMDTAHVEEAAAPPAPVAPVPDSNPTEQRQAETTDTPAFTEVQMDDDVDMDDSRA